MPRNYRHATSLDMSFDNSSCLLVKIRTLEQDRYHCSNVTPLKQELDCVQGFGWYALIRLLHLLVVVLHDVC